MDLVPSFIFEIIFTKMYLRFLKEKGDENFFVFLCNETGELFKKYGLKEDPPEFDIHGEKFMKGWQVAALLPEITSTLKSFGDIRMNLINYLKGHPSYPAKTILLSVLYEKILEARIKTGGLSYDMVDKEARNYFEIISADKDEHEKVKKKAKKNLNDLKEP